MEKNGGSCAGKQRFHVFVSDNSSTGGEMSVNADSGAASPAGRLCAAAASRRRRCSGCRR